MEEARSTPAHSGLHRRTWEPVRPSSPTKSLSEMLIGYNHTSGPSRNQQRSHPVVPEENTVQNRKQTTSACFKLVGLDGCCATIDNQQPIPSGQGAGARSPSPREAALLSAPLRVHGATQAAGSWPRGEYYIFTREHQQTHWSPFCLLSFCERELFKHLLNTPLDM